MVSNFLISNPFAGLEDFFTSVVDILKSIFESLLTGYQILETSIIIPSTLMVVLPAFFSLCVTIVVFSMILKFILGR